MFGLRYPIFQAPTGSIAAEELAIAVSEAGGMGAMGLTWLNAQTARRQVTAVREGTKNLFQVNFALAFEPQGLDAALEAGAPVVTFSWGDPAKYVARVRSAGALLGVQVTSREEADRARDLGADFLICQGTEAGGHVQAERSLWETLPEVLGGVPVVAAGGIADGKGIAKALERGAQGAMLGTRFVATQESRAHDVYKQKLVEGEETALTYCFDGGWPDAQHRVLTNSTFRNWDPQKPKEREVIAYSRVGEEIERYEDVAPRQGMTGDIEAMCLYAGEGCRLIHDLPRAGELVERLWKEASASLKG